MGPSSVISRLVFSGLSFENKLIKTKNAARHSPTRTPCAKPTRGRATSTPYVCSETLWFVLRKSVRLGPLFSLSLSLKNNKQSYSRRREE